MSALHVIRHGQARLFSDNYDRLSELGVTQAEHLAKSWIERGVQPDAVWGGSLKRQRQTAEAVASVFAASGQLWPDYQSLDGFNEYPAEEIMHKLLPLLRERREDIDAIASDFEAGEDPKDRYSSLHRLLEAVIACWVRGDYDEGLVSIDWRQFSDSVRDAFRRAMSAAGSGQTVAVFTSGGPIGVSMQTVMESPELKAAELNWRVQNCSVTHYTFSGARVSLDRFNDVSHLPESLHTYR